MELNNTENSKNKEHESNMGNPEDLYLTAKKGLKNFSEEMGLSEKESSAIQQVVSKLFSNIQDDIKKLKERNEYLEKENIELRNNMESYKERLERISNTFSYRVYSFFKRIFKGKKN